MNSTGKRWPMDNSTSTGKGQIYEPPLEKGGYMNFTGEGWTHKPLLEKRVEVFVFILLQYPSLYL